MFQHRCSEIGSIGKWVLIHFNIIEAEVCKVVLGFAWQILITALHTCVSIMLKCASMQI